MFRLVSVVAKSLAEPIKIARVWSLQAWCSCQRSGILLKHRRQCETFTLKTFVILFHTA